MIYTHCIGKCQKTLYNVIDNSSQLKQLYWLIFSFHILQMTWMTGFKGSIVWLVIEWLGILDSPFLSEGLKLMRIKGLLDKGTLAITPWIKIVKFKMWKTDGRHSNFHVVMKYQEEKKSSLEISLISRKLHNHSTYRTQNLERQTYTAGILRIKKMSMSAFLPKFSNKPYIEMKVQ